MSASETCQDMGEPDLLIEGLSVWILDFKHEMIQAKVLCEAHGATVWIEEWFVENHFIIDFGRQCAALLERIGADPQSDPGAVFRTYEPDLEIKIKPTDRFGHLSAEIEITYYMSQWHRFVFDIDQSYLPEIIRQCSRIARKYPER